MPDRVVQTGRVRAELHHAWDQKHPGRTTKRCYGLGMEQNDEEKQKDDDPLQAEVFNIRSPPVLFPPLKRARPAAHDQEDIELEDEDEDPLPVDPDAQSQINVADIRQRMVSIYWQG